MRGKFQNIVGTVGDTPIVKINHLAPDHVTMWAKIEAFTAVTAFSPLGALSYLELNMAETGESVLEQPVVRAAANRLGRTPAQVVLRWGVQRGTAVIPKTSQPGRLRENKALFDFELTDEEMVAIAALNCDRRFNDPGHFCEEAFGCFYPIYD